MKIDISGNAESLLARLLVRDITILVMMTAIYLQTILPKTIREQDLARMKFWIWQKEILPSIGHSQHRFGCELSVFNRRLTNGEE